MRVDRVLAIAHRILRQFRRDRRTIALLFVAPLVMLTAFYFLLRGGAQVPVVSVVNEDQGALGSVLAAKLESAPGITAHASSLAAAREDLSNSRIAAYVYLEPGFSRAVRESAVAAPELHLERSEPAVGEAVVLAVTRAASVSRDGAPVGSAPTFRPHIVYRYGGPTLDTLDYFGAPFIGLVVFFLVFVITSVSFLRERSQGTLERLFASSLRRGEVIVGYMLGFTLVALLQAALVLVFALYVLGIHNSGSVWLVFAMELLLVLAAVNLGIFLSTFARTEFQAVQFIPLVIVPQVLLSGIIVPVTGEPGWMQVVSHLLPLTYAVDGLRGIMLRGAGMANPSLQLDAVVVLAFCIAMVGAGTASLRRGG